jgi:Do/DeqQ family serine protease
VIRGISKKLNNVFGLVLLTLVTVQAQAISPEALKQGIPSLAPMLEDVTAAVVNIRVTKSAPVSGRYFFDVPEGAKRFFEDLPVPGNDKQRRPYATGAGSGVIVDARSGLIITNHHVVEGASSISVHLSDDRMLDASLLGSDASTDLALLKVEAEDLTDIDFADVGSVQVGDYVVAIGNPFGIGQTVTSGIVSALGRAGINNDNYEDFIQTDAAINVGNSGGALVDMEGHLIGINTAIISGSGGSNGIGFAVPVDMVSTVMKHLERDGEVRRGMLGVTIADVTPELATALDIDMDYGAVVTSILPNSAAEKAGVEISDIIVEIDGKEVQGSRQLRNSVGLMLQNQQVELVLHRNGERKMVRVRIGDSNGGALVSDASATSSVEFRGAQVAAKEIGKLHKNKQLVVLSSSRGGAAWSAGLREGDVILKVNQQAITDLADFKTAITAEKESNDRRFFVLTVLREGRQMLLFIP